MFRKALFFFCLSALFWSCQNKQKTPDVSGIPVKLELIRFEQDFFALDSARLGEGMQQLLQKYPGFTVDFIERILGIPMADQTGMKEAALLQFLHDYRPILKQAEAAVGNMSTQTASVKKGLQYVKHYFPDYRLPEKLITFVGPLDAYAEGKTGGYGDIITTDALAVGLQLHLGSQHEIYLSEQGQQLYPAYISRRFDPAYIPVNCMKNIIDDLYAGSGSDKTLLDQMVDKGKRLYLLDLFLPDAPDSLKIGYTAGQLKGALKNEGLIWNFFTENNLLYETDAQKLKSYLGDGPKTTELGDDSPGYIALFTGRQMVRAYMEKFPETSLKDLLAMDAKRILNDSKYKPR